MRTIGKSTKRVNLSEIGGTLGGKTVGKLLSFETKYYKERLKGQRFRGKKFNFFLPFFRNRSLFWLKIEI